MENRKETFKKVILNISEYLKKGEDLVGSQLIEEFVKSASGDINKIDEINNRDRDLKIGIVGEVKAGKSSFLNALIFDGENYLPKAATPMTAALTKIGYSEKAYAIIHFYSQEDWIGVLNEERKFKEIVENKLRELKIEYNKRQEKMKPGQAQMIVKQSPPTFESALRMCKAEGKITQVLQDCYNLVKMADDSNININDWLGKTKTIDSNVERELFNYIGANGVYASIVKYAEIYLANPLLNGIEIIDTPGLNDPISSRSRKTKEFIVECDVVFLLSYLGQFMGAEDVGFLNREISSANIKEAFIVGSKLDSGILDYRGEPHCSIFTAYKASKNGYLYEGRKAIKEQAALPYSAEVFKVLNEKCLLGKEVIYLTSSLMYGAAKALMKKKRYTEEENKIITQIKKRFTGFEENPDFMLALAGFHTLKTQVLETTRVRKEEIIQNRIKEFINVRISMYLKQLELINEDLSYRLKLLETADAQDLRNKIMLISKNLERSRRQIRGIFEIAETDLVNHMKAIRVNIKNEVENFITLTTSSETARRERTLSSGLFGCWKTTIVEDVKYPVANVSNATSNIVGFISSCDKLILNESTKIFEIIKIKRQLKEAVFGVFDTSDDNFDEDDILIPVDSTLSKMQNIDIKVSIKDYAAKLEKEFPSALVKGRADVAKLENALMRTLIEASEEYGVNLEDKTNEAKINVSNYSTSFIDEIKAKAVGNLETIEKQLTNKEAFIKENQNFAKYIIEAKEQLRKI